MVGGRVSGRRGSSSQANAKQQPNATKDTKSPKRRRASGRTAATGSQAAKEQHEAEAASIDDGIEILDKYISSLDQMKKLSVTEREKGPDLGDVKHGTRDWASPDCIEVMSEVIDENTRPSLEFVLGVLGVSEVPKQSNERHRSQGARALTSGLRNRSIQRKKESIEKQRAEERKRKEKEKLEKQEKERKEKERKEKLRIEKQKKEEEAKKVQLEKERKEKEEKERKQLEKERLERERLEKEKHEKEKIKKERLEQERIEKLRVEADEKEREQSEKDRVEKRRTSKRRRRFTGIERKGHVTNDDSRSAGGDKTKSVTPTPKRRSATGKQLISSNQLEELEAEIEKAFPEPEPEPESQVRSFARPLTGARRGARLRSASDERQRLSDHDSTPPQPLTKGTRGQDSTSRSQATDSHQKVTTEKTGRGRGRPPKNANSQKNAKNTQGTRDKITTGANASKSKVKSSQESKDRQDSESDTHRLLSAEKLETETNATNENEKERQARTSISNQSPAKNVHKEQNTGSSVHNNADKLEEDKDMLHQSEYKSGEDSIEADHSQPHTLQSQPVTKKNKQSFSSKSKPSEKMSLSQLAIAAEQMEAAEAVASLQTETPQKEGDVPQEPDQESSIRTSHHSEDNEVSNAKLHPSAEDHSPSDTEEQPSTTNKTETPKSVVTRRRRGGIKRSKTDTRFSVGAGNGEPRTPESEVLLPRRTKRPRRGEKDAEEKVMNKEKETSKPGTKGQEVSEEQASTKKEAIEEKTSPVLPSEADKEDATRSRRVSGRRSSGPAMRGEMGNYQPQTRLRRESSHLQDPSFMFHESDPFMLDCVEVWRIINQAKISIPFRDPVQEKDAPGYFDVIDQPMDLSTVLMHLKDKSIETPVQFLEEMTLICENAMDFNDKSTDIYDLAMELRGMIRKHTKPIVRKWREAQGQAVSSSDESSGKEGTERGRKGASRGNRRGKPSGTRGRGGYRGGRGRGTGRGAGRGSRGRGRGGGRGGRKAKAPLHDHATESDDSDTHETPTPKRGTRGRTRGRGAGRRSTKEAASSSKRGKRGRPAAEDDDGARKKRRTSSRR